MSDHPTPAGGLSAEERDKIRSAVNMLRVGGYPAMYRAVERILAARDAEHAARLAEVEAERDRAQSRAADYEERYEVSHDSRMHAERCFERAEADARDARTALDRVCALLELYESWDGTRPHPGESSPRQRTQLRDALGLAAPRADHLDPGGTP